MASWLTDDPPSTGGGGGTSDHRALSHKNDANQHSGDAVNVTATFPGDDDPSTKTLTAAVAALLPQFGNGVRAARLLCFTDAVDGTATEVVPAFRSYGTAASGVVPSGWKALADPVPVEVIAATAGGLPAFFIPEGPLLGLYSLPEGGGPWINEGPLTGEALFVLAGSGTGGAQWFVPTNANFYGVAPIAGEPADRYEEVFVDVGQVVTLAWSDDSIHKSPGVSTQAEVNGWSELVFGGITVAAVIRVDSFDPEADLTLPGVIGGTPVYENNRYLVAALDDSDPAWQGIYEFGSNGAPPVRREPGAEGTGVGNWDNVTVVKVPGFGMGAGRQIPETWYRGGDGGWRMVGELLEASAITADADLDPRFDVQPVDATGGSIDLALDAFLEGAGLGRRQRIIRIDGEAGNTVTLLGTFNGSIVDRTLAPGEGVEVYGGALGLMLLG